MPDPSKQKQLKTEAVMLFASKSLDSQDAIMESSVEQAGIVSGLSVPDAPCAAESLGKMVMRTR